MKARIPNQGPTGANMMKKLQEVQSNMSALQDELGTVLGLALALVRLLREFL